MLANPQPGQRVEFRYRKQLRELTGLHGKQGTVVIVGKGRPRNHGVHVDGGKLIFVPCGHLRKAK